QTRKWQGQDGLERYTTEIVISELQMLDGRTESTSGYRPPASNQQNKAEPKTQSGLGSPLPGNRPTQQQFNPPADFDDDIPFAPVGLQHPALLTCC
ncbi:single-strand DNA binding protein, partial [Idiomarina xiamenensis 10-D-4]